MDSVRVIVSEFGAVLGKHSERLVVRSPIEPELDAWDHPTQLFLPLGPQLHLPLEMKKEIDKKNYKKVEIPFFRISEIVVAAKGVSFSADLVLECCQRGIPITFLEYSGHPYAQINSPMLNATVLTRREQFRSYDDERGVKLSKKIVGGKLRNQSTLLKYFGKYLSESRPETWRGVRDNIQRIENLENNLASIFGERIDDTRQSLMTLEANAAGYYWDSVRTILSTKTEFETREHRGTEEPVNAALNYGYGILYSRVWAAVANAGLEPYAGFLHVDRPGKPSLVLDLVEEFRQPCVDRAIVAFFNQGREVNLERGLLDPDSRKAVAEKVCERLDSPEPYDGRKLRMNSIVQAQARRVASFLRGERDYEPFVMRW